MAKQRYVKSWNAMVSLLSFLMNKFFRMFSFINIEGTLEKIHHYHVHI